MPPLTQLEPETDPGWTARTMAEPMERALREKGAPYPAFQSLVKSLRFAVGSKEEFGTRFHLSPEKVEAFEEGELPPTDFPERSIREASQLLGPVDRWTKAIHDAGRSDKGS